MPDGELIGSDEVTEYTPVPSSWITGSTNPYANGWYEIDDDSPWALPTRTQDTSPVPGKTYYYEGVINMSEVTAIAYSTYQTYLMYRTSTSGTYTNLIPIKDYPDMVPTPNMLDATTLSDGMEKQIPGIMRMGDGYQFTANYTPENYTKVKGLENHQYEYALWLGGSTAGVPDGHNGKFSWTGDIRAGFPGKGVDEVQDMNITAVPSTDTVWTSGST